MNVVWSKGQATVAEVVDALVEPPQLAYNTVLTVMRILEDKGFLNHSKAKDGRAFIYRATVSRAAANRAAARNTIGRFFGGSAEALMLNLIEFEDLREEEIERLRAALESKGRTQ